MFTIHGNGISWEEHINIDGSYLSDMNCCYFYYHFQTYELVNIYH